MEVHRLNNPPLRLLLQHDSKLLLCSPVRGDCCLREYNITPHTVAAVHYIRDLRIRQENEVAVPSLNITNRLGGGKPMAVLNDVCPQVEYHGAGRPALRRHQVKAVTAIPYLLDEKYGNISPLPPTHLKFLEKVRRTPSCRVY